jgi:K+-sensing histidine kinase KdpD
MTPLANATSDNAAPDSAALLVTVAENAIRRLDDVRLPLHILLENRFGDLNENQEELLGSARAAVDAIAEELAAMRQIGELESGTRQLRRDRLKLKDLVGALAPMLHAIAKSRGATIEIDAPPLLSPLHGDGALLSSALAALLGGVIAAATRGSIARVNVAESGGRFRIEGHGGVPSHSTLAAIAATRAIEAHRGSVRWLDDGVEIDLPAA